MNQIGIACEDTRISAIVNGLTVLTAFDAEYTDGYSYLGVGSRVGASGGLTATLTDGCRPRLHGLPSPRNTAMNSLPLPAMRRKR